MYINKDERIDYERRFNGYIMQIIKITFINFLKKNRKKKELSLNDYTKDGVELLEVIVGEKDVFLEESFCPEQLELIFLEKEVYSAVKSLTKKEKLAIFLCYVLEMDRNEVARIMNYKTNYAVYKLCERAIKKIKDNMKGERDYD